MAAKSQKAPLNIVLREYRKGRGWTQAEMATALGVIDLTVRRWEQGQAIPSPYHVKKLCELFGTSSEALGLLQQNMSQPLAESPPDREETRGISLPEGEVSKEEGRQASPFLLSFSFQVSRFSFSFLLVLLVGLLCTTLLVSILLEGRTTSFFVGSTRSIAVLPLNNPPHALHGALMQPLLYQDPLTDSNTLANQGEHWASGGETCFFASDGYHVQGHPRAFCQETGVAYQNITISVDMVITRGYAGALLLRDQSLQAHNGAYIFEISTNGRYHISNLAMYGSIQNWTYSSVLHQGWQVSNTLQVIASGNLFLFYLNSIYVTSIRDNWYKSGGMSFACFAQGTACEATFHNMKVYTLSS